MIRTLISFTYSHIKLFSWDNSVNIASIHPSIIVCRFGSTKLSVIGFLLVVKIGFFPAVKLKGRHDQWIVTLLWHLRNFYVFFLRCLMSVNHETSAFLSVFAKIKKFLMKYSFETRNKILILLWYFKFLIHSSSDKLLFLPNKFGQYFDTCHLLKQRICKVVKLDPLPFVRT